MTAEMRHHIDDQFSSLAKKLGFNDTAEDETLRLIRLVSRECFTSGYLLGYAEGLKRGADLTEECGAILHPVNQRILSQMMEDTRG